MTIPMRLKKMPMPTASDSSSRFWLRASPRGTRAGFAVLPDGADGRVTVTVLPKPWASNRGVVREYTHVPGSTTHIVMYETELAALATSASSVTVIVFILRPISEGGGASLTRGWTRNGDGDWHVVVVVWILHIGLGPVWTPCGGRVRAVLDRLVRKPLYQA